jgi:hypothetical protein
MDAVMHDMILATELEVDSKYVVEDPHTGERYNYLVREIVADKGSNGEHNMYKAGGTNSYDPIIGRLTREKNKWDELIKKNRGVMDKIIGSIEAALKEPRDEGYRRARPVDIARWQDESLKLQEEFVEMRANSARLLPSIEDCQYNRLIEEMTRRNMRALRDKFFRDGDLVYLEKGVTWAMNYAEKNLLQLNFRALESFS